MLQHCCTGTTCQYLCVNVLGPFLLQFLQSFETWRFCQYLWSSVDSSRGMCKWPACWCSTTHRAWSIQTDTVAEIKHCRQQVDTHVLLFILLGYGQNHCMKPQNRQSVYDTLNSASHKLQAAVNNLERSLAMSQAQPANARMPGGSNPAGHAPPAGGSIKGAAGGSARGAGGFTPVRPGRRTLQDENQGI